MNDFEKPPLREAPAHEVAPPDHDAGGRPPARREAGGGARRWALGLAVIAVLVAALGFGVWRHYRQYREVQTTAAQHRDFVPTVRVEAVRASPPKMMVALPATTNAYEAASIFARASGYIEKRYVDIGSRVTAGQILAEITAPELDHQIAQAEASVVQLQGTLRQTEANRSLAQITNERNLPLVA
jgi:multidrug efflux pump subunit AcrA (membrane-fusion protein)